MNLARSALRLAARAVGPFGPDRLDAEGLWRRAGAGPGEVDPDVRARLACLYTSLREDARLHALGIHLMDTVMMGVARTHLAQRRWTGPVDGPLPPILVVASLPRTGSTLLQRALAAVPGARSLPLWAHMSPYPPPSPEEWAAGAPDRRSRAARVLTGFDVAYPDVRARHGIGAELPEECSWTMMGSGLSTQFWSSWPVHGYAEWMAAQDPTPAYRWLRARLVALSAGARWWVLKAPMHLLALETLLAVVPEAKVVLLHRDPARVLPSTHALIRAMHAAVSDDRDDARSAAFTTRLLGRAVDHLADLRDGPSADRLHDVDHAELTHDPAAVVARVHRWAGLDWTPAHHTALAAWLAAHPRPRSAPPWAEAPAPTDPTPWARYVARFRPTPGA